MRIDRPSHPRLCSCLRTMKTPPLDARPRVSHPANIAVAVLLVLLPATVGCVQRRLTIRSNPPGARVFVGDNEIGATPVSTDFVYYGTRRIRLVKDGYETFVVNQPIPTPWYQIPPLDFVTRESRPRGDSRRARGQLSARAVARSPDPAGARSRRAIARRQRRPADFGRCSNDPINRHCDAVTGRSRPCPLRPADRSLRHPAAGARPAPPTSTRFRHRTTAAVSFRRVAIARMTNWNIRRIIWRHPLRPRSRLNGIADDDTGVASDLVGEDSHILKDRTQLSWSSSLTFAAASLSCRRPRGC